jgi:hypothetical protein
MLNENQFYEDKVNENATKEKDNVFVKTSKNSMNQNVIKNCNWFPKE